MNIALLLFWLAPAGAVLALVFAYLFYKQIMAASPGDDEMQRIAGYVREGAFAYLKRQYRVVAVVFVVLVLLLCWQAYGLGQQHGLVPFAFLTGGFFSGLAGFFGMNTATLASNRTTQGAKESLNNGLQVAFRAGAVMGLVVVGLGLIDISAWFVFLKFIFPYFPGIGQAMSLEQITVVMLCFGMGASTQALFARVGGGIFTKSADVGADLVGKTEANIPEDDPRNPATIADNVGDNVGDVAGMGADLYESYCGSILATAALGAAAAIAIGQRDFSLNFVVAPMVLAGVGIMLSVASIYFVKTKEGATQKNLLWALRYGVWGASALIVVAALIVTGLVLGLEVTFPRGTLGWFGVFLSIITGLLAGVAIGYFTEYYTSSEYKPTKWISSQCVTGPATTIIGGVAEGMFSAWAPLSIVGVATILAYAFAGGFTYPALGLYGVGIAAVGMLATLGITLATDAYGPIADNAGGNAEMTHQPPEVRERTDALDSLGNTTAATGKGFAIGSAALTALALLAAFVEEVRIGIQREATGYVNANKANLVENKPVRIGNYKKYAFLPEKAVIEGSGADLSDEQNELRKDYQESRLYPAYVDVTGGDPYVLDTTGVATPATQEQVAKFHNPKTPDDERPNLVHLKRVQDASLADFMDFYHVNLMNPKVLVGMFLGVLMVFTFSGLTMKAVGRAAGRMVEEVRRQFRELHLLTDENAKADYARCVHIATVGAQREMIVPALLAVAMPIAVGLLLDVSGVMGLLAGGLTCGFAVAIFMANAGGAWDNAKKYIETHGKMTAKEVTEDESVRNQIPQSIRDELVKKAENAVNDGRPDAIIYGKGSDDHHAGVVGDTVGDPFKDTSGPSLNILIKLMSMVAVVFAGVIVKLSPWIGGLLGIGG